MSGENHDAGTAEYVVHGVRLRVQAEHQDVAAAVMRRLRPYATTRAGMTDLRLRYVSDLSAAGVRPAVGEQRVVYEVPGGTVRYHPGTDVLTADVAGVRLHAALGVGDTFIAGGGWVGPQRHIGVHTLTTLVLMEHFERCGRFSLHAGCLARSGRGVLLAGPSGSGKSTLALALALAGLDYLADDLVFLAPDDERLRVYGVRDVVGLTAATRARFPELSAACGEAPDAGFPKYLVRLEEAVQTSVAAVCEPVMLVFPEIVDSPSSRLEAMEGAEAWRRLVPDVLLTDADSSQAHLQAIAALTSQVSCYQLRGGQDVRASARLIAERL
jgi:hypothetical protein